MCVMCRHMAKFGHGDEMAACYAEIGRDGYVEYLVDEGDGTFLYVSENPYSKKPVSLCPWCGRDLWED